MYYFAYSFLFMGIASCAIIFFDIMLGHNQPMAIMNVVWPLTGLYGGPLALVIYYTVGKRKETDKEKAINWRSVLKSTLHCGSGCTLGDICAETLTALVSVTILQNPVFNGWLIDFVFAFLIGIVFQYFAIKPMSDISPGEAIRRALKADALSLIAWQVGMYGWMSAVIFLIYKHPLPKTSPIFWFMMQIAMVVGFFIAYPVNYWLLRKGIKEAM